MILDIFSLVVIGILVGFVIWLVVLLGPMPGNIAKKRGHPQADAINVVGWIGVITLGLAWPIALIWAFTRTKEQQSEDLNERVTALESALKAQGGDS